MISTENLTLSYGSRILFEDVNVKFTPGNCYGLIGANGAGKSTFVRLLSGAEESSHGDVRIPKGLRLSVLKQDHFAYNDVEVLTTVIMGHERLHEIMLQKEELYAKSDFSEADGIYAGELEASFADMDGWEAEANAGKLLCGLGVPTEFHQQKVVDLSDAMKVKVLLAQAIFGEPDILLLDEPTNHLDVQSIIWLEEFLINFKHTVIVVSHDRHFLDKVCTHVADIDFQKLTLFKGNYSFWYMSSQLALKQRQDSNKKKTEKVKELQAFIARFSANAAKSKQATARKNMISKIELDDIKPSSRKYPWVVFKPERDLGRSVLAVKDLTIKDEDQALLKNVSFTVGRGERVALVGDDGLITKVLDVISQTTEPASGTVLWGSSVSHGYFPKEHESFFKNDYDLIDWLRQYSEDQAENFIRGFLGRMLFSGDESRKRCDVLSGGEKVRCMFSKLMLENPNVLVMDGPTSHLDLESITSLNNALMKFPGTLIFASHDVEFISTLATRVVEVGPNVFDDSPMSLDEYLEKKAAEREQNA
jgi:ATPase subunit of ABC transporter with duplicated ATPase domains